MNAEPLSGLDWQFIALVLALALTLGGGLIWLLRHNREDLVSLEERLAEDRDADKDPDSPPR